MKESKVAYKVVKGLEDLAKEKKDNQGIPKAVTIRRATAYAMDNRSKWDK